MRLFLRERGELEEVVRGTWFSLLEMTSPGLPFAFSLSSCELYREREGEGDLWRGTEGEGLGEGAGERERKDGEEGSGVAPKVTMAF